MSPLPPTVVEQFAVAFKRTPAGDYGGLKTRGEAAHWLATEAFVAKSSAAWQAVQVLQWRVQRRACLRPTEPGDVVVLDTLYRVEEGTLPPLEQVAMSPKAFTEKLENDVMQFRVDGTQAIRAIASGKLSKAELRYFCFQFVPPAIDFTKQIAFATMVLPRDVAGFAFENLYEEGGKGVPENSHVKLLTRFLREFEIDLNDDEAMLSWVPADALASTNAQLRMLWHADPGWAMGSMFLMEKLLPLEHTPFRDGLLASGVSREAMIFFDVHIEGEAHHAADWLKIAEQHLRTPAQQSVAYRAAMERGRWYKRCWEALWEGFCAWKETGSAPHLPAKELSTTA
jgi:hypothetical protein